MTQNALIKEVKSKNKRSNIMLCFQTVFDLLPQIIVVYTAGLAFANELTQQTILIVSGLILGCFLLKAVFGYTAVWKAHQAAYNCLTELRSQIITHLKELPLGFFQDRKLGDLTNIVQHDVEQVEIYLAHGLPEIMSATLLPAIIFLVMLVVDWRLALVMVVGLPLMWLTKRISAPLWEKNMKIFADSTKSMQENLMEYVANISVIKAFGKEETKTEKTIRAAKDYVYWVKKSMAGVSVPIGLIALFMESGVVLVMILGTWLLSKGEISTMRVILFMVLGTAFTSSVAKTATFQHYGIMFKQAMSGIGSILNVPVPNRKEEHLTVTNGRIEIQNLTFSYPGKKAALENINLTFQKGSKNALVGTSGCGKTTLANLLMGFWAPANGCILIDGKNTAHMSEKQLSTLFSMVQQEVFLFNLSMEENIRIGKPSATMDEITSAAKKARIHDFIMSLPNQYQTLAGESGVKFSGGEKQRISIARMILKNAPIIILDEATAAIDSENEAFIQAAIDDLGKGKTMIMIAHHLNTIREADQIVVMDQGTVLSTGAHKDLLASCPLYRKMAEDQNRVDNWNIKEG